MARRRKKRSTRADRLLGGIYKATVIAVMEADPGGHAERVWDDHVAKAERAGIPARKVESVVKKATKDAFTIGELLDEMPEAIIQLHNDGFEVVGGGGSS